MNIQILDNDQYKKYVDHLGDKVQFFSVKTVFGLYDVVVENGGTKEELRTIHKALIENLIDKAVKAALITGKKKVK